MSARIHIPLHSRDHNNPLQDASISPCEQYRWWLVRRRRVVSLGDCPKTLAFVMLNPSKANHIIDDPTLKRCRYHASRLGYDVLVVVNLFAWRDPDPKVLHTLRPKQVIGPLNQAVLAAAVRQADTIVCGWGAHESQVLRYQEAWVWRQAVLNEKPLWCLGKTLSGAPKHPLARGRHRIKNDQPLLLWEPRDPPVLVQEICP